MASSNEPDFVSDIRIVPDYESNQKLQKEILNALNFLLLTEMNQEAMPLTRPKILVFRPTGRSGDEFQKRVAPELTEDSVYYLIMAYTIKPGKMIEIPSEHRGTIKNLTTRLVISDGKLVPNNTEYYQFNEESFLELAKEICKEYPHVKLSGQTVAVKRFKLLADILDEIAEGELKLNDLGPDTEKNLEKIFKSCGKNICPVIQNFAELLRGNYKPPSDQYKILQFLSKAVGYNPE